MIERKLYQCEICGTSYSDRHECETCEGKHKVIKKIAGAKYLPYKMNAQDCPKTIEVEFEDGSRAIYKR